MEMRLNKKEIWVISLFEFKMGHKAAETTYNISKAFGQRTANECAVQWWFKKFCKGEESLEDEECSSEIDNGVESRQQIWSFSNYTRSCWRTQHWQFYSHLVFEANLERWKSLISGCLVSWLKKKIVILKCPLILDNKSEPFLNQIVLWDEKWILYDN